MFSINLLVVLSLISIFYCGRPSFGWVYSQYNSNIKLLLNPNYYYLTPNCLGPSKWSRWHTNVPPCFLNLFHILSTNPAFLNLSYSKLIPDMTQKLFSRRPELTIRLNGQLSLKVIFCYSAPQFKTYFEITFTDFVTILLRVKYTILH